MRASVIAAVERRNTLPPFTAANLPSPIAWWDMNQIAGADGSTPTALVDQFGNSNAATGSALLNTAGNGVNGRGVLTFDGSHQFITSAPLQAFPGKRGAIFAVFRCQKTDDGEGVMATYDQPAPAYLAYASAVSPFNKFYDGTDFLNSTGDWQYDWQFQAWIRTGDTTMEFWRNGVREQLWTVADTQQANDVTYIGGTSSGPSFNGQLAELIAIGGVPNVEQLAAFNAAMSARYNMTQVLCLGDSLTRGYDSNNPVIDSYPALLRQHSTTWTTVTNAGIDGQTAADIIAGFATQATANLLTLMRHRIAVVWCGTNDLVAGASAATTYASIVSLCGMLRALGMPVVVLTILPRVAVGVPPTFEADRQTVNANTLANYLSFASAIYDAGSAAGIGTIADVTGPNYGPDGTHLNPDGYTIVAAGVAAAIASL